MYGKSFKIDDTPLLTDLGKAMGCTTNTVVIKQATHPFPPLPLQRRHAQMVIDGASSNKINYDAYD